MAPRRLAIVRGDVPEEVRPINVVARLAEASRVGDAEGADHLQERLGEPVLR